MISTKKKVLFIITAVLFTGYIIFHFVSLEKYKNKLVVEYIDVGNADSIMIKFPDNRTMLIDTGLYESFPEIQKTMNKYGVSEIDYLFITHNHDDHIGSFYELSRIYGISQIYMPKTPIKNPETELFEKTVADKNIPVNIIKCGDVIIDEKDIYAEVISPSKDIKYSDKNDYSAVLYFKYKDTSFMFTGDATSNIEAYLQSYHPQKLKKCNVLKLAHHGSDTSSSLPFLRNLDPDYAVITTGVSEPERPSEKLIYNLESLGIKYYSTKDYGNITFISDGKKLAIETKKPAT